MMRKAEDLVFLQVLLSITAPAALAATALFRNRPLLFIPAVLLLFVFIYLFPVFRKRENLWMFVISSPALLIPDVALAVMISSDFLFWDFMISNVLSSIIICAAMFSIEQIVLAMITRTIWKKQYKMFSV